MTPQEYVTAAQSTSADISPELLERLCDPSVLSLFLFNAGRLELLVETFDDIKKHVFYGRPINLHRDLHDPPEHEEVCRMLCNGKTVKLLHGILGKLTEAGELMQQFATSVAAVKPIDEVNIIEEMGDDAWYDAEILTALDVTHEQIWELNIKKLKARYPNRFTEEAALNRDLVNERKILENEN